MKEAVFRSSSTSRTRMAQLESFHPINKDFEGAGNHARTTAAAAILGVVGGGSLELRGAEINFVGGGVEGHGFGARLGGEGLNDGQFVWRILVGNGGCA